MNKRIISLLLALMMVVALVPTAYAAGTGVGLSVTSTADTSALQEGDVVTVTVTLPEVANFAGANIEIKYDATKFTYNGDATSDFTANTFFSAPSAGAVRMLTMEDTNTKTLSAGTVALRATFTVKSGVIGTASFGFGSVTKISKYDAGTYTSSGFSTTWDSNKTVTIVEPTVEVSGVTLDKSALSLAVGGSETLVATVSPDDATDKTVTWSSTDSTVATVVNGTVTAIKEGTATITVKTSNNKTATCTVTVYKPTVEVSGVTLDKSALSLVVGGSATLVATVSPDDATDKTVTWSSTDSTVATVVNGTVTAIKAGTATITVKTSNNKTATCTVTVSKPAAVISKDDITVAAVTYTGSPLTPAVTVKGLNTTDYTVSYANNTNAGTATVTVSASANGEYVFAPVVKEFTIAKAPATIVASNKTITVGDAAPTLGSSDYTVYGLLGSDTLTTAPSISYESTPDTTKEGTYKIVVSGAVAANYEFTYQFGTLTINKKDTPVLPPVSGNFTIKFDTNGGSFVTDVVKAGGSVVNINNYKTVKVGYEFDGWYHDKNLTAKVNFLYVNGNTTVYAKWIKSTSAPCDGASSCVTHGFVDVDQNEWYHESVDFVVKYGLMEGVGNNKFDPKGVMSRAMIVTVLYRMENQPAVKGKNTFTDVANNAWYTNAIIWASENKIVEGYGNGKFGTNDAITREQMAKIMYKYAEYKGYDTTARASLSAFSDADKISSWAVKEMQWAVAVGLVNGMGNGTIAPRGSAQRCQIAAILMRFSEKVVK